MKNTKAISIGKLGEEIFRKKKAGLKYTHLIENGFAKHKAQARAQLKRYLAAKVLFTWGNRRPQRYYPTSIKSEVMKYLLSENVPVEPSGVTRRLNELRQDVRLQTLVEYVLPLLPDVPLAMHNIHLYFESKSSFYEDLPWTESKKNRGKRCQQKIGQGMVTCTVYPGGAVDIQVRCSNKPFRLESLIDISRLLVFLGEIKGFVTSILFDTHGRAIPDVMDWILTECDINKDVVVSDAFHLTSLHLQGKVRVRDFECVLGMYFKVMGPDTVFRTEARVAPRMKVGQIIAALFGLRDYIPEN